MNVRARRASTKFVLDGSLHDCTLLSARQLLDVGLRIMQMFCSSYWNVSHPSGHAGLEVNVGAVIRASLLHRYLEHVRSVSPYTFKHLCTSSLINLLGCSTLPTTPFLKLRRAWQ